MNIKNTPTQNLEKQSNQRLDNSANQKRVYESVNIGDLHFSNFPANALPKSNTKAYRLMSYLVDGKKHDRNKLILDPLLGESMRSALQDLRGDKLSHWLIHSSVCEHTGAKAIQLDPRHFSTT
jgi:hypothetical protein